MKDTSICRIIELNIRPVKQEQIKKLICLILSSFSEEFKKVNFAWPT